jgi:coenzyme F420-reducing hydrogenase beta subunit
VLKEIRQLEGKFALVAIPSIVYEVRLLQRLDSSYKDRISVIIGLICGHQKTANYAEYLGWKMGVAPGNLQSIDFRRKIEGMPANSYSTEVTGVIDGQLQTKVAKQNELPGTDWGLGFFKSNFSDFTEDALNECADLVVGDAWLSKYTADSRGTNIILTRSSSLLKILESGNQRGDIHLETLTVGDLLRSQTSLIRQNVEEIGYRFSYLQRKGWRVPYRLRRASPERIALLRKAIQRARFKTSQTSHIAYLKARAQGDLQVFDETMRPLTKNYRRIQRLTKVRNKLSRRL